MLGPNKFYPSVNAKLQEDKENLDKIMAREGYGFLEIYDPAEVGYYAPLENLDEFYLTKLDPPGQKKTD